MGHHHIFQCPLIIDISPLTHQFECAYWRRYMLKLLFLKILWSSSLEIATPCQANNNLSNINDSRLTKCLIFWLHICSMLTCCGHPKYTNMSKDHMVTCWQSCQDLSFINKKNTSFEYHVSNIFGETPKIWF